MTGCYEVLTIALTGNDTDTIFECIVLRKRIPMSNRPAYSVLEYGVKCHNCNTLSKGGRPIVVIARLGRGIVFSLITEHGEWFESNNHYNQLLCGGISVPH